MEKYHLIRDRIKGICEDRCCEEAISAYANKTCIFNLECHVLPGAGRRERWLNYWSHPIESGLYAGGRVEHYYDITARKLLENQLVRNGEELAAEV